MRKLILCLSLFFMGFIGLVTFIGCEKEEREEKLKLTVVEESTMPLISKYVWLEERPFDFKDDGRSGPLPVFYKNSISIDSFLITGVLRKQVVFNKHRIEKVTCTKLQGSASIDGVIHSVYSVNILFKNQANYLIDKAYMAGIQGTFTYVPTDLNKSLIHISSNMLWVRNVREGSHTKVRYFDDYYCKEKSWYLYTLTTNTGATGNIRKTGRSEVSEAFVYNHE